MNEFETILSNLKDGYEGEASCGEGTLTGDVLQATANELARIWSCDLETLTGQVFVSTAQGDALDRCCADYGVVRKDGEEDETLRAKVLPAVRGEGTVDVLLCGTDGTGAPELVDEVQAVVDANRPVGADAVVYAGLECPVDVEAQLTLEDGFTADGVAEQFAEEFAGFLLDCAYQTSIISYLKVSQLLLSCDGVEDVSEFFLSGEADSLPLTERQIPVVGSITLTLAE